ncbi:uncharacterized protein M421DRAFT_88908 [Didymella exigua CBS 183.55]|uniref:F-box domain-containing protein n=1 Tax=Didymella exigua CBS 183.55 TaxID=1150837 RepID=A0A6A5S8D5_9PLEO|nr:uncharacterized protein M421DRAFT_88908 [Didymella exigua CBS 183.55]KAF1933767.1 hypothetical protein M421DRAFT_88908 [Didymella exigua CBS 183.55]
MPLHQLPEELLLQIALQLPDSATPKHLKDLSLTSRKLQPIAQEALHTTARLAISCGCHPKVNTVVRLLRTLLDRPDLASKVKTLRSRAVRKRVAKLYEETGFELLAFRDRCVEKLEELAFGGLLLALLPNLIDLDFWIKDHQHSPPSSECISGLWDSTAPPETILRGWKSMQHLVTGDTSMLKCGIEFDRLTVLGLRTVSIGTVLRLNGPGSPQGAGNLINDGYHIGDDLSTELNTGYFLEQLSSVQKSLEMLSTTLETTEDGELDWLVDMCKRPNKSMKQFTALKPLTLPQPFVFETRTASWNPIDNFQPNELPPELEQLELLFPDESVEEWARGFLSENFYSASSPVSVQEFIAGKRSLKKLILTCREDVRNGGDVSYFTDEVDEMWWTLSTVYSIEAEAHDQQRGTRENLAELYEDRGLNEDDSEIDDEDDGEDLDEGDVNDEEWEDDRNEHLQGLLRPGLAGLPGDLGAAPQTTFDTAELVCTDETLILAYLRSVATHSFGRTAEHIGMAVGWGVARVDKAVEALLMDNRVEYRTDDSEGRTLHFVRENEVILEHDRLFGKPENRSHSGDTAAWPRQKRPEAGACHRIKILRCLRDLAEPNKEEGLSENKLNDKLNMEPGLTQDAMFLLLDGGFIKSRTNQGLSRNVIYVRDSEELCDDDSRRRRVAIKRLAANVPGGISERFAMSFKSELAEQTLTLDLLRSYQSEGIKPEGMLRDEISDAIHTPLMKVVYACTRLVRDRHVRNFVDKYIFARESEELRRQDRLKEMFAEAYAKWDTDDSMPELEEY